MVTMPTLRIESTQPSICYTEFDNIPEDLIAKVFNEEQFFVREFEHLYVDKRRTELEQKYWNNDYYALKDHFYPHVLKITEELIKSDPIRYPFFAKDFKIWFDSHFITGPGHMGFVPIVDQLGFNQPLHIDNRFVMMSGIINVEENLTGTIFTKETNAWLDNGLGTTDEEIIYRASGKKHSGTFWLNGDNNWHGVQEVLKTRKIILINLFF